MKRRDLFEFEDLPWLPGWLRNLVTDVLREGVVLGGNVYRSVTPVLARIIREQRATRVVDLCSGSSGPWVRLKSGLNAQQVDFELVFTDKYPNTPAFQAAVARIGDGRTTFVGESIDATTVPPHLTGIRTLFTSFHHLPPRTARRVLQDAYQQRTSICVFEFTGRTWIPILLSLLLGPILVWTQVPRLRPLTLRRLLFTYLVPIAPLVVAWDGVVSNLRTYSTGELTDMTRDLASDDYEWDIGQLPRGTRPGPPVTYLIGHPRVGPGIG